MKGTGMLYYLEIEDTKFNMYRVSYQNIMEWNSETNLWYAINWIPMSIPRPKC